MERLLILRREHLLAAAPHYISAGRGAHLMGPAERVCVCVDGCVQRPGSPFPPRPPPFDTFSHNSCRLILLNWFTTEVFYFLPARISVPATLHMFVRIGFGLVTAWLDFLSTRGQRVERTKIFQGALIFYYSTKETLNKSSTVRFLSSRYL